MQKTRKQKIRGHHGGKTEPAAALCCRVTKVFATNANPSLDIIHQVHCAASSRCSSIPTVTAHTCCFFDKTYIDKTIVTYVRIMYYGNVKQRLCTQCSWVHHPSSSDIQVRWNRHQERRLSSVASCCFMWNLPRQLHLSCHVSYRKTRQTIQNPSIFLYLLTVLFWSTTYSHAWRW